MAWSFNKPSLDTEYAACANRWTRETQFARHANGHQQRTRDFSVALLDFLVLVDFEDLVVDTDEALLRLVEADLPPAFLGRDFRTSAPIGVSLSLLHNDQRQLYTTPP